MNKILLVGLCISLMLVSGCLNKNKEPITCDKLSDDGYCLKNCFYSTTYQDDKWWHIATDVPKPYVREYCGVMVDGEYIQND